MDRQPQEEDDEEVVGVPEHLKVGASDEIQGRGNHEEEHHRDDVARDASCRGEADSDGILHRMTQHYATGRIEEKEKKF